MNIMVKRGNLDNIITYEHICDTLVDLQNIPINESTLGSTAIVLQGGSGLEVYMADSNKEWHLITEFSGNGGDSNSGAALEIRLLTSSDYNIETGIPTLENPSENELYLTPNTSGEPNNLYNEWIYVNDGWEKFGNGSVNIDLSAYALQTDLGNYALKTDTVLNTTLSRGRKNNTTIGNSSFAFGLGVVASGEASHAEGLETEATNAFAHAEGYGTGAFGQQSHAEGYYTKAVGNNSHAEGRNTIAYENTAHAEGNITEARGIYSHSEGEGTKTYGQASHAEGMATIAVSTNQHVQGRYNIPSNGYADIVGNGTSDDTRSNAYTLDWSGNGWYAGGVTITTTLNRGRKADTTIGEGSFAFGNNVIASGNQSHAEGASTAASGPQSHAEGAGTTASGYQSHAEGGGTTASGNYSHAEGSGTTASVICSHAEGSGTRASGDYSHAEGSGTRASGASSHAEGADTAASGNQSHAEGVSTTASGNYSHAEGDHTTASGHQSHAEGGYGTTASGNQSHAEGGGTIAAGLDQHVQGRYNIEDSNNIYADIVGNGTFTNRSNAYTLDWSGNGWYAGNITSANGILTLGNVSINSTQLATILQNGSNENGLKIHICTSSEYNATTKVPTIASPATDTIYFVPNGATGTNKYNEWAYINNNWESLGTYEIDLSGYARTEDIPTGTAADKNVDTTITNGSTSQNIPTSEAVASFVEGKGYLTEHQDISNKVDKVDGKGLSTNDYTTAEKEKLAGIASGAEVNVQSDWNVTDSSSDAFIRNKPTIPVVDSALTTNSTSQNVPTSAAVATLVRDAINGSSGSGSNIDLSDKADKTDTVLNTTLSRGRASGSSVGTNSFAFGSDVVASGSNSHAEGYQTTASGSISHAEGFFTIASGDMAHAEGAYTTASSETSHAEGDDTLASGMRSHAEGVSTTASGNSSHAEGNGSVASGDYSHAEGQSIAKGEWSHAEGNGSVASGSAAHAEGVDSFAGGWCSHAEGGGWGSSHSIVLSSTDNETVYLTDGQTLPRLLGANIYIRNGTGPDAGIKAQAWVIAVEYSSDENKSRISLTNTLGVLSSERVTYAETTASLGGYSHAEGDITLAKGYASHAEGKETIAGGERSHAEGLKTSADGTTSHVEGEYTTASGECQHVSGRYNIDDPTSTYAEIVGGGDNTNGRKNIRTLDWRGNGWYAGNITAGRSITIGSTTITEGALQRLLALLSS